MGVQAHERRDELEELRRANRMMLEALTGAVCGDTADHHVAEHLLADLASDPRVASRIQAIIEDDSREHMLDGSQIVIDAVRTTLGVEHV